MSDTLRKSGAGTETLVLLTLQMRDCKHNATGDRLSVNSEGWCGLWQAGEHALPWAIKFNKNKTR